MEEQLNLEPEQIGMSINKDDEVSFKYWEIKEIEKGITRKRVYKLIELDNIYKEQIDDSDKKELKRTREWNKNDKLIIDHLKITNKIQTDVLKIWGNKPLTGIVDYEILTEKKLDEDKSFLKYKNFTPKQIAKKFNVHHYTVLRWIKSGELKGQKINNQWSITSKNLKDFIDKFCY